MSAATPLLRREINPKLHLLSSSASLGVLPFTYAFRAASFITNPSPALKHLLYFFFYSLHFPQFLFHAHVIPLIFRPFKN